MEIQHHRPRRHRFAAYAGAALRGARLAYRYQTQYAPQVQEAVSRARGYLKRQREAMPVNRSVRPRATTIRDVGGYNQLTTFRLKSGKGASRRERQAKLMKAMVQKIQYRFSGINEMTQGEGFFPLSHQYITEQYDHLPVYCINLTSVLQGGVQNAAPMWRLFMNKTNNLTGWTVWNGQNSNGANTTNWSAEDMGGFDQVNVGRKSLIDWFRLRTTVWGKQTAPTVLSFQLAKFSDELMCPEYEPLRTGSFTADNNDKSDPFWKMVVKPLLSNPASSLIHPRTVSKPRILKTWTVKINPTSSDENDSDPHCKFLDIFHRMNVLMDYTSRPAYDQGNSNLIAAGTYAVVGGNNDPSYRAYPDPLDRSYYLIVKSLQQDFVGQGGTANKAQTATFDMNLQVRHTTVEGNR